MDLLEEARRPGAGRFTLDLDRACELMASYQLVDSSMYILKLVQWAVASHPTAVHITISEHEVVVEHDGTTPPEELNLGSLMSPAEGPLLDLGVGIFAAIGQGAHTITLTGPRGSVALVGGTSPEALAKVRLTLRGLPATPLRKPLAKGVAALVPLAYVLGILWISLGPWAIVPAVCFAGLTGWAQLSQAANTRRDCYWVRQRCVYAPVPVLLNGTPVNRAPLGRTVFEEGGQLPACRAVLQPQNGPAQVEWVKSGVIIEVETAPPGFQEGLHAVVDAGPLAVDLSQFSLVRDSARQSLLTRLNSLRDQGTLDP